MLDCTFGFHILWMKESIESNENNLIEVIKGYDICTSLGLISMVDIIFDLLLHLSFNNMIFLLDELLHEKEQFKAVSDDLDQTFAEMSGY